MGELADEEADEFAELLRLAAELTKLVVLVVVVVVVLDDDDDEDADEDVALLKTMLLLLFDGEIEDGEVKSDATTAVNEFTAFDMII